MQHSQAIIFFVQVGVMLTVALVCGQLMRRIRQPAVLGELIGGIFLGPTVLGTFAPGAYAAIFPSDATVAVAREGVIRIGMLFFLFVAGLEVNLSVLRQRGLSFALTSIIGAALPFAAGVLVARAIPTLWQAPEHIDDRTFAWFLGTALSISALPVIARILMDLKLASHQIGIIVLSAATIDDLIGWSLFAVILGATGSDTAPRSVIGSFVMVVLFAASVILIGQRVAQPMLRKSKTLITWPTGFIAASAILVLFAAATAEYIGVHAVFGAFLVGIALGQGLSPEEEQQAHEIIYQFAVSFFAPLYFVSIGLRADFAANFDPTLVFVVVAIACVGKISGAGLGAWLGGMSPRDSLAVGFAMNARGAMEMILASVALEHRLINERLYVALIVMALVTSMLSGPVLQRLVVRDAEPAS